MDTFAEFQAKQLAFAISTANQLFQDLIDQEKEDDDAKNEEVAECVVHFMDNSNNVSLGWRWSDWGGIEFYGVEV